MKETEGRERKEGRLERKERDLEGRQGGREGGSTRKEKKGDGW
jgi:hypothetical protein